MAGMPYRREIDGLRAIAVLAVVLYHAGVPSMPGGFVGVDVFFVISGYLITSLLLREYGQQGRIDLPGFYVRRVRRLLPALWVVVAATVMASMLMLQPLSSLMLGTLDSAVASLLFVANFYFAANSGGYFDGPVDEMPLLHLWSLSVEEQYYLAVPVVLMLVWRWHPRRWRLWLGLASLASFALAEYWLRVSPTTAFYQMPARFWELGVGGLIAGCASGRLRAAWPPCLVGAGVALIVAAVAMTPHSHFPGLGALPAVAGASLVLYAVNDTERLGPVGCWLASRPLVAVGLISYSLYLWHWPLLAFERAVSVEPASLVVRLGLCGVAVLLAWASYRWIERPFRRPSVDPSRVRVIAFGVAASAILIVMAWGLRPEHSTTPLEELVWRTQQDHPANMGDCHVRLEDEVAALPGHLCQSDPTRSPEVAVWGDSHALAWQPLAWGIAKSEGQSAIGFTMDSCPPVADYDLDRADVPRHRDRCRRFNDAVMGYLHGHRVRTLIISARWLEYFPPSEGGSGGAARELATGLDRALARASSQADHIIVIGPPPQLRDSAPKCIGNRQLEACAMPRIEYERMAAPSRSLLAQLASRFPKVVVVDPADFFCNALECPVMKGDYALFWDDDHVSTTAARAFARDYVRDRNRWTARWGPPAGAGMDDNRDPIATPSAGASR